MKTTNQHFKIFKKECERLKDKFELNGFELRYYFTDRNARASVDTSDSQSGILRISLGKEILPDSDCTTETIKYLAKHEMLHCLLAELVDAGYRRFTNKDEYYRLEEKLVNKLGKLL